MNIEHLTSFSVTMQLQNVMNSNQFQKAKEAIARVRSCTLYKILALKDFIDCVLKCLIKMDD